jgi:NAD(P)-dependent dehydrogenase (short-subunit alcohol dehydrogenase family)
MTESPQTESRVAVVTGAAGGIGAALVNVLARDGYRVAALDLNGNGAAAVAEAAGPGHAGFALDVSDEAAVVAVFDRIVAEFGRVDALATCAGITDPTPFMEATAAEFRRAFEINTLGTFLCVREAARRMTEGGTICTVASVAGLRGGGLFGQASYSASKGGVVALTRNAARALAGRGIRVNCIAPAATATQMLHDALADDAFRKTMLAGIPLGRVSEPREQAEAIAWLLSPKSSYVHGETLVNDGGIMMS